MNPCVGVRCTWIPDADCPGNLSLGRHTGDGKSDGETFLGRTWMFFLGGRGGKRKSQGKVSRVGRWTTRDFKQSHFDIYYMLSSGGFNTACLQVITKGVLDPPLPLTEHAFLPSTTRRPSPHIEDGEGTTAPRSTTDSTEQWV